MQGAGFGRKYFGNPNDPEDRGKLPLRTVAAAIVGGTVSALSGGKFANGAAAAAMVHVFNAEKPKEGNGDENEFIIIGDPDSTHVVMKYGPDGLLKVMGINNVEVEIKKIKTKVNIEVKRLEFAGSLDSGAQKRGYEFFKKELNMNFVLKPTEYKDNFININIDRTKFFRGSGSYPVGPEGNGWFEVFYNYDVKVRVIGEWDKVNP